MVDEGSYEIMPYKEIIQLKKQIAELQQKTGDTSSKELLNSMASLTKSMNNMLQLFSSAAEEMKLEEKTEGELSQKISPLIDKVERLEDQNKTIAEGLVAIADMVKDMRGKKEMHKPLPPEPEPFGGLDEGLPPLEPPRPTGGPLPYHDSVRVVTRRPMPPLGGQMPPPPGMPPFGRPMPPPGGPMPPPPGMPPGPDMGPLPPLPPLDEEPKKKGFMGMFKK